MSQEALMMMLDDVARRAPARRRIEYVPASRVVTVLRSGVMVVRVMGSGGSGGTYNAAGNGGTVGIKTVRVTQGNAYTVTIPSAAAGASNTGVDGGTLTITGPGVNISVPGGRGGRVGQSGQNAAPSGLDAYWLGGLGRTSWGGDAPRFFGSDTETLLRGFGRTGSSAETVVPDVACVLLVPWASFAYGSFGRGGNANGGGHGGAGGGGGAGGSGHSSPTGGNGGLAWVTLEFLEDDHV